jgi:hypothetical protein
MIAETLCGRRCLNGEPGTPPTARDHARSAATELRADDRAPDVRDHGVSMIMGKRRDKPAWRRRWKSSALKG